MTVDHNPEQSMPPLPMEEEKEERTVGNSEEEMIYVMSPQQPHHHRKPYGFLKSTVIVRNHQGMTFLDCDSGLNGISEGFAEKIGLDVITHDRPLTLVLGGGIQE